MHCKPCRTLKVLVCGEIWVINFGMVAFPLENFCKNFDGRQNCSELGVDEKGSYHLCLLDRASLWELKNKRPTWCHLLFYFTSFVINMFRTLIYPSSGACDCVVELLHWSFRSCFAVCWRFGAAGFRVVSVLQAEAQLQLCLSLQHGYYSNPTALDLQHTTKQEHNFSCASACSMDTTQNQPHQVSNTQRNKNKTTSVLIQQHSRRLLMMDILMSKTCWVRKK